jgi:two-component system response regulator VanR
MENSGHVVSTKELSDRVWNDAVCFSRNDSVAVHICHLREKMQDTLKPFCYVKTVWGVGYALE